MLCVIEEIVGFKMVDNVFPEYFLKYLDKVGGECNWAVVCCNGCAVTLMEWSD